ncbi:protein SSUH2 homolog isoform X3 [Lates calcarifer]|uniref:Protein SSUH2 homolog isoform X3 n=1 Tax=Lates calcarifer TaxID=8187 RepID=A0AAJ8B5Y4_LATCA|nr:protein SSUH2 homolog isoform X3 [Lates calcarifer]
MDPPSPDSIQPLSKRDAQQAFIKYASEKCCYSTKPAEEGVITLMETFDTYRYCLETFTETRTMERSQKPYFGEKIDTEQRTPPGKWEIPVNAPDFFHEGRHEVEVPHTSSVKGESPACPAVGLEDCGVCNGAAEVRCFVCLGRGRIRVFTVLIVSWHNNRDQHTVEQFSGLKMSKLDKVPGRMMFTDTGDMVHPVRNFSDPAVVQTSESFLRKHQKNLQSSKTCILKQRQTIELLPISKVTYEWREESHVFVVYGRNFKVSAEDYPAACCSCCSLM